MATDILGTEDEDDIDYMSLDDDAFGDLPESSATIEQKQEEQKTITVEKQEEQEDRQDILGAEVVDETSKTPEVDVDADVDVDNTTKEEVKADSANTELDFSSEYKKLLAPFKANGKDMQVNSVEEARTLMMMGANYNKKMAGLKPSLRVLKTLENNNLLDEDKLNFLIDLDKKDPGAISKLLKDSGINPLDLDTEEAAVYKPNTYNASNKEVELDAVLDDIRDTAAFKDTIDIVSTKWDEESRRVLVDNPTIIKVINDHVSAGIYDQIAQRVEREKMLGRLNGVSDIAAYKEIGDAMQAAGEFNPKGVVQTSTEQAATTQTKASNTDKRRAAGSTVKAGKTTKPSQEFNPLALSDEEFAKLAESNFA